MGFLDDASSKLDALTGGGKPAAAVEAKPEFTADVPLSEPESGSSGQVGTSYNGQGDQPNPLDAGIPIEFIHFGKVHPGIGKKFPHLSFAPASETTPPEGHAIMFRDAIEREAVTLFGFVSSTKQALKDVNASKGAIGAVADMASAAFGGGGGSAPDPSQLDTFLTDIQTVVGTVNKDTILYPDIHEAGKKLHETRATYIAFCKSLNDYYVKPPQGSPLDAAAGAIANIPGVGNILATVQRFAFKYLDLYLAAYLELRVTHEKSIEAGAHDLTVKAIKADYKDFTFVYPIWFKKPDSQKKKDDKKDDDNLLKPVTDKIDAVKKDVEEKVNDVYDFLGMNSAPPKTPGTAALGAIFGAYKGPKETVPDALPSASTCLINGMDAAMQDIHGIPDFVKNVMTKINDVNLGLLEELYGRIMAGGAEGAIDSSAMVMAGRRHLSKRIVEIMGDLASGILPGGDISMNVQDGKKLSAQAFIAKLIEDKLIHFVDPIINFAIGDLAGQIEASRKKAADNKAQTMEVLLGRLPWFTSLMFRNTFFPIWNLVVEKVFETISPEIAKIVKEVNSVFETAKNAVDTAQDYKARAGHASDKMASGVSSADDLSQVKDSVTDESPEAKARREEREKQQAEKDKLDSFYKPNDKDEMFPVTSRVENGEGKKVEAEIESVLPKTAAPADSSAAAPAAAPAAS
jgi:hypothetical protein